MTVVINTENNNFDFTTYDDHVYVYVRVSTNKQAITSQLNEVNNYCIKERLYPKKENIFIDEAISGKIDWKDRKINIIINKVKKNDIIIIPEISRLGRNMNEVQEILCLCNKNKIIIRDIKNDIILDGKFHSNMIGSMLAMFAQMERHLISERTKQGLLIAKAKGNLTGRKRGIKKNRLDGHEEFIIKSLKDGKTMIALAIELNVDKKQLYKFVYDKNLKENLN